MSILAIQFSEFSMNNALSTVDFRKLGNILCSNAEFASRLQQILVRNQFVANPVNLTLEKDPVDAALCIIKCKASKFSTFLLYAASLGSKSKVHISLIQPKVDESKFGSMFKKK